MPSSSDSSSSLSEPGDEARSGSGTKQPEEAADLHYGPHIPGERELRLLGGLDGRRVLALGCRRPAAIVALARAGAKVIAVDESAVRVDQTRQAAEMAEERVELHRTDPADLAFLRGDSIDAAVSIYALAEVDDLNRIFRQVHRVLGPNGPLVLSMPHPAYSTIAEQALNPPALERTYHDPSPLTSRSETGAPDLQHGISAVFTSLVRAKFVIDTLLEPEATRQGGGGQWTPAMAWMPPTLLIRARKQGV